MNTALTTDRVLLTVHVPFTIKRRGGRKRIVAPEGAPSWTPPRPEIDDTLLKALARAFRWKRLAESGGFGSLGDLASAEAINPSYLSRVLRLTLLAPDIVEAILDGQQPRHLTLPLLMAPFPLEWQQQRARFGITIARSEGDGAPDVRGGS